MRIKELQLVPDEVRFIIVIEGSELAAPLTAEDRDETIRRVGNALALHDFALVKESTWERDPSDNHPDGWVATIVLTAFKDSGRRNLHIPPQPEPAGDPVTAMLKHYLWLAFQPLLEFPDDPL